VYKYSTPFFRSILLISSGATSRSSIAYFQTVPSRITALLLTASISETLIITPDKFDVGELIGAVKH
jgi:hypothetical protein